MQIYHIRNVLNIVNSQLYCGGNNMVGSNENLLTILRHESTSQDLRVVLLTSGVFVWEKSGNCIATTVY